MFEYQLSWARRMIKYLSVILAVQQKGSELSELCSLVIWVKRCLVFACFCNFLSLKWKVFFSVLVLLFSGSIPYVSGNNLI